MKYSRFISALSIAILCFSSLAVSAKSMLWEVSSKTATIYLQGSIHVLKAEHYPLAPEIEAAYKKSQVVGFEVDIAEMNSPSTQMLVMQKGMLANGETLSKQLSPRTLKTATKKASEMGLSFMMFERFKPWMFNMTLTMMKYQQLGFNQKHGVDQYFYSKAKKDGKQTIALETLEYQLSVFDELSKENADEFTLQTMQELDKLESAMNTMITSWKTGNADVMNNTIIRELHKFPDVYNALFVKRNNNWVKKINRYLQRKQTCMFVVGSGHLVGKDSVVAKLKQLGYKVKQL